MVSVVGLDAGKAPGPGTPGSRGAPDLAIRDRVLNLVHKPIEERSCHG